MIFLAKFSKKNYLSKVSIRDVRQVGPLTFAYYFTKKSLQVVGNNLKVHSRNWQANSFDIIWVASPPNLSRTLENGTHRFALICKYLQVHSRNSQVHLFVPTKFDKVGGLVPIFENGLTCKFQERTCKYLQISTNLLVPIFESFGHIQFE